MSSTDRITEAKLGGLADHAVAAYAMIDAAAGDEPSYKKVLNRAKPTIEDPIPHDEYAVARLTEISEASIDALIRDFAEDFLRRCHERNVIESERLIADTETRRRFCDWCRDAYDLTVEQGNEYHPRAAINAQAMRLFFAGVTPAKYAAWTLAQDAADDD